MKSKNYLLLVILFFALYSCQDKVDTESLTSGTWNVLEITKEGTLTKRDTNECKLQFKIDNTVIATYKNVVYKGVWKTLSSDPTDDDPIIEHDLFINFPKKASLLHLTGSYRISDQSKDKIILETANTNSPITLVLQKK